MVKIYGTDIDKKVLARAVEGRYEPAALKEAPPKIIGDAALKLGGNNAAPNWNFAIGSSLSF